MKHLIPILLALTTFLLSCSHPPLPPYDYHSHPYDATSALVLAKDAEDDMLDGCIDEANRQLVFLSVSPTSRASLNITIDSIMYRMYRLRFTNTVQELVSLTAPKLKDQFEKAGWKASVEVQSLTTMDSYEIYTVILLHLSLQ